MRKTIIFLLCLFPLNTFAGISTIVIAYGTGDVPVSSSIDLN
jgi:hypothetical protein